jgi:hypothetical protein
MQLIKHMNRREKNSVPKIDSDSMTPIKSCKVFIKSVIDF